ncbi:MAG TPA: outer membrane protein transport protein [Pseudomonadales bacterium]|nr:outer membrane protein transport protein [Pseudomonadales bacterium]
MKRLKQSLLTIALAGAASTVHAEITTNLTLGNPKALAMGNAVTADPPGIDSIHFNPAGLAKIKGRQYQWKILAADIVSETDFGDQAPKVKNQIDSFPVTQRRNAGAFDDKVINTHSKTSDPVLILPGVGLTKVPALVLPFAGVAINPPDTDITFADAFYSPNGIGYSRDESDPGGYQGQQASVVRLTYLSPSIGFEAAKNFYVGASIGLSWQGLGFDLNMRAPNFVTYGAKQISDAALSDPTCIATKIAPLQALCGSLGPYDDLFHLKLELSNALSPSVNLGVLWEPVPYLAFGAVYQSEGRSELEGAYQLDYTERWQNFFSNLSALTKPLGLSVGKAQDKGTAKLDFVEPQHFAIGTSIRVIPRLKINFDWKWVDYSAWKTFDIRFDQKIDFLKFAKLLQSENATDDILRFPRHYRSVWSWALGGEYQVNNQLALRAGYEPRKSAIPASKVDLLLPIYDADLYTAGFAFQLNENQLIEGAFGYLTSKFKIKNGVGEQSSNFNMYDDSVRNAIYNPYMGLSADVDTHAYVVSVAYTNKF